jgi:GNAT superfamily N-acetyltransferase
MSHDEPRVRPLSPRELTAAVALSAGVGWNQVEADWRLFLDHGHVRAVDDTRGRLAATAATLPLGPELAWISMVIVRPDCRGRGLATRLLEQCVREIQESGRAPGLDATPAGRPVYLRLGFSDAFTLARWRRAGGGSSPAAAGVLRGYELRRVADADRPVVAALDGAASGVDRGLVLSALAARSPELAVAAWQEDGRLAGFVLGRDGRTATHLGPLVAESEEVALALLARALAAVRGEVTIDVADRFTGAAGWLSGSGFAIERPFTRMYLGRSRPFGDPARVVAVAGPELG